MPSRTPEAIIADALRMISIMLPGLRSDHRQQARLLTEALHQGGYAITIRGDRQEKEEGSVNEKQERLLAAYRDKWVRLNSLNALKADIDAEVRDLHASQRQLANALAALGQESEVPQP